MTTTKTYAQKRRALLRNTDCIEGQDHFMVFLRLESLTEVEIFYCAKCLFAIDARGEEVHLP